MPRRSPTAALPVPYAEAVALAGSEARLVRGVSRTTRTNWKTRGVPWGCLGPILREQLGAQNGHPRAIVPATAEAARAHALLERLAQRTGMKGATWASVATLLQMAVTTRRRPGRAVHPD